VVEALHVVWVDVVVDDTADDNADEDILVALKYSVVLAENIVDMLLLQQQ